MLLFVCICRFFKKWQNHLECQITHTAGMLAAGRGIVEVQTIFFQTLLFRLPADAARKDCLCLNGKNAKKPNGFHRSQVKLLLPCLLTCVVQDSIANLLAQMFPFTCVSPVIFSLTCGCVSRTSWSLCHGADSACKHFSLFTNPVSDGVPEEFCKFLDSETQVLQARSGLQQSCTNPLFCNSDTSFATTTSLQYFSIALAVITQLSTFHP